MYLHNYTENSKKYLKLENYSDIIFVSVSIDGANGTKEY